MSSAKDRSVYHPFCALPASFSCRWGTVVARSATTSQPTWRQRDFAKALDPTVIETLAALESPSCVYTLTELD